MTDSRREPTPPPASAAAGHVVLIGAPSPLRSAVAGQLRTAAALLACLDTPDRLPSALASAAVGGHGIAGAAIVFVTVPRPPGRPRRLGRHDHGTRRRPGCPARAHRSPWHLPRHRRIPGHPGRAQRRLKAALDHDLHPLDDPSWGYEGTLLGPSRRITDATFRDLTRWRPHGTPAAESLAGML